MDVGTVKIRSTTKDKWNPNGAQDMKILRALLFKSCKYTKKQMHSPKKAFQKKKCLFKGNAKSNGRGKSFYLSNPFFCSLHFI